jgi:uncharacterized membrane protein YdjX (TVP38/TMEM64 family)
VTTTVLATTTLFYLGKSLNIFLLALIGALGATASDFIMYEFVKEEAGKTIWNFRGRKIKIPRIRNKFLIKISPLIVAILIATPLPDELAMLLFGLEKYETKKFIIYVYILKFIGIFAVVGAGKII